MRNPVHWLSRDQQCRSGTWASIEGHFIQWCMSQYIGWGSLDLHCSWARHFTNTTECKNNRSQRSKKNIPQFTHKTHSFTLILKCSSLTKSINNTRKLVRNLNSQTSELACQHQSGSPISCHPTRENTTLANRGYLLTGCISRTTALPQSPETTL